MHSAFWSNTKSVWHLKKAFVGVLSYGTNFFCILQNEIRIVFLKFFFNILCFPGVSYYSVKEIMIFA